MMNHEKYENKFIVGNKYKYESKLTLVNSF